MKKMVIIFLAFILVSFLCSKEDLLVIKNARILTVTQGVIDKGHILIQNGKIVDVGMDIEIPPEAKVLDAEGKLITPGLIDSHSHLGLGPRRMETQEIRVDNSAILAKAGVKVIIKSDEALSMGSLRELPMHTALAVKGGLDKKLLYAPLL